MHAVVCLLRDQGAWRLLREHMSVPFQTYGRGIGMPGNEARTDED
jgi:hypothetical protein